MFYKIIILYFTFLITDETDETEVQITNLKNKIIGFYDRLSDFCNENKITTISGCTNYGITNNFTLIRHFLKENEEKNESNYYDFMRINGSYKEYEFIKGAIITLFMFFVDESATIASYISTKKESLNSLIRFLQEMNKNQSEFVKILHVLITSIEKLIIFDKFKINDDFNNFFKTLSEIIAKEKHEIIQIERNQGIQNYQRTTEYQEDDQYERTNEYSNYDQYNNERAREDRKIYTYIYIGISSIVTIVVIIYNAIRTCPDACENN